MKSRVLYLIGVFIILSLTGCEHKELCYHHPHTAQVKLVFDWQYAPEANPEGMCVFFYPIDDVQRSVPQRFDFTGTMGGEVELQVGKYQIICYNNDTESILFSDMDNYQTHTAFTREGGLFETIYGNTAGKGPQSTDERVIISPDMMWGCTVITAEISELPDQTLTLHPHPMVCTYTYEIRNVKGLNHITQLCGSLSGMSSSLILSTEELGTECVTIPFEAYSDGVSTISGKFYTFGNSPQTDIQNHMNLYVWMKDGSKYYYGSNNDKFNVTQQIENAKDKYNVHIIVEGLDLPLPMADDNGFEPSVDDWQEIEIDINM